MKKWHWFRFLWLRKAAERALRKLKRVQARKREAFRKATGGGG